MKQIKSLTALACLAAFLVSVSFAAADKTCCEKAKEKGEKCTHKCCVQAAKDGKVCEKCNPAKDKK